MNAQNMRTRSLHAWLMLRRLGWDAVGAGFILLASAVWWAIAIPHSRSALLEQKEAVGRLQQSLEHGRNAMPAVRQSPAQERASVFYEALGDKKYNEQHLKILFSLAQHAGLSLNQAEYKSAFNKDGGFHTYQIQLPVKGSYGAIRQFCEQALLVIPYASLDEMSFKREAVAKGMLEARLRFTLYLADRPGAPPAQERQS